MPYATLADLTSRFGVAELRQLTDRELPAAGAVVVEVVDRALADADGVVNRFLGARFSVPLGAPYPSDLVRVACDVARYFLHDQAPTEIARTHYEDALAWLRSVADGKLPLVGDDGSVLPTKQTAFSTSAVASYPGQGAFGADFSQRWVSAP